MKYKSKFIDGLEIQTLKPKKDRTNLYIVIVGIITLATMYYIHSQVMFILETLIN